jgi:zinc transporter ZupT
MNPLFLTSMAAVSTSVGGYCAVLLHRKVKLLMAFGAGVLVGASLLDLLPAALTEAATSSWSRVMVLPIAALGGLIIFSVAEAASHLSRTAAASRTAGRVSASLLIVHSLLDGTAIFAASTISLKMGLVVGVGVVAHDVSDGLNTILLSAGGQKPRWTDFGFLALDAAAPIAGGLVAADLFTLSPALIMFFLSLAAGSFLFTAIFSLLPDAWQSDRRSMVPWLGAGGFLLVLCLTRLLGSFG